MERLKACLCCTHTIELQVNAAGHILVCKHFAPLLINAARVNGATECASCLRCVSLIMHAGRACAMFQLLLSQRAAPVLQGAAGSHCQPVRKGGQHRGQPAGGLALLPRVKGGR